MPNNIKTVFQNLDGALTGDWNFGNTQKHNNNYDLSNPNKVLFRTTDKNEYEKKKLELQQNAWLKDRWIKANQDLSVQAFAGLNNVKLMYRDADLMDAFPEIGAALDIYAEESVLTDNHGQVITVSSKSERIKAILEDLFVNRLDIQVMSQMIIRGMCKYGNQFMLLNIDNKNGVMGWRQLPVFNVERLENGITNPYGGQAFTIPMNNKQDADTATRFVWTDETNTQVPFRNWQIAHFRLINNSMYLPYGVSALNSARRHWRLLSLMEDMMLIYRLERSIERRVYKIYVGAIDDADVQAYVEDIANNFKRTPIIDPMTGQIDLRKNIMPVHKDTPIPLLDGRTITIEELAKEFNSGKTNYVYSIQDKTHKIVPGKVVWCGKNYTADKLVKITLDDDTHCIMAPEHELIMRDGSKKRADEVIIGESVMPFYRKIDKNSQKLFDRYEQIYNPNSGKFEFTHRLIGENVAKENAEYNTIHHKDFNKYNNEPTNLLWCDYFEHHKMHSELAKRNWKDEEKRQKHIENLKKSLKGRIISPIHKQNISNTLKIKYGNGELDYIKEINKKQIIEYNKLETTKQLRREKGLEIGYRKDFEEYNNSELHKKHDEIRKIASKNSWIGDGRTNRTQKMNIHFDDFIWDSILNEILSHRITKRKELLEYINTNLIDYLISINDNKRLEHNHFISREVLENRIREKGFATISEYITESLKNHTIKNIEIIGGDDVYCMTVVGLNGEEDRHNFALCTINSDGSWNQNGLFVSNCCDQDIFIPVRDPNAANPIETLPAAQNLTAIDDIKYIQNKVLTALRIPKTFLNFEDAAGNGQNLALMDVRFTRTINRIQQAFLMEMNKVASIHLYLLGFEDDLTNFTLSMTNPSTQAEQLEIDNITKKIGAIQTAVADPGGGIPIMSITRALKEIMKWSDKEIQENLEEIRLEKALANELQMTNAIIKRTGIFDTVDRIYGEPNAQYPEQPQGGDEQGGGGPMGGGGAPPPPSMGGGDDFGSGLDSIGTPGSEEGGEIGGNEGEMPAEDAASGGQEQNGMMESNKKTTNLITELVSKSENNKKQVISQRPKVYNDAFLINEEFNDMINSLDKYLED